MGFKLVSTIGLTPFNVSLVFSDKSFGEDIDNIGTIFDYYVIIDNLNCPSVLFKYYPKLDFSVSSKEFTIRRAINLLIPYIMHNGFHVSIMTDIYNFEYIKNEVNPNSIIVDFNKFDKKFEYSDLTYSDVVFMNKNSTFQDIVDVRSYLVSSQISVKVVYEDKENLTDKLMDALIYDLTPFTWR